MPDTEVQARAQELIRDIYGKKYDAAKNSKQKTDLAKKLLDQAAESKGDPGSHFVLLRVAKDVAVLAADAETALDAVNHIVATYDVDAMEMRLACAKRLASEAKLSSQHAALAAQVYALVDIAVAEDNFDAASQLGEMARAAAQKARSYPLLKQIAARMQKLDEVRQAHAEYQKAVARLEESPTDPEANLAAGRYLCLSRSDWERGIPMLALGSDPALKAPAVKELAGADSPDAQIAVGDAWWDLAQTKEGHQRNSYLLRAGHWYEQAQPNATSTLMKVRLQDRLKEIDKIESPAVQVARTRSGPNQSPMRWGQVRTVNRFKPEAARPAGQLQVQMGTITSLAFSPDGTILFTGSDSVPMVGLWEMASRRPRGSIGPSPESLVPGRKYDTRAIALSVDGSTLAWIGSGSGTVKTWKWATGQFRETVGGLDADIKSFSVSPDGAIVASVQGYRGENKIRLWDTATGKLARTFEGHRSFVICVAFSPDGSLLASAGRYGEVFLWDVATAKRVREMDPGSMPSSLVFAADGSTLASTDRNFIRLSDVATGELQRTLTDSDATGLAMAFHPDGSLLVSCGTTVKLWDVATGELQRTIAGFNKPPRSVAFSPDGAFLAVAAHNTVQFWRSR
ncbi:MAG: WD40 repeat domain-containing protein [Planctomycetes bacterium]|nr:WD40 repeat domain-containing protein [Planctomycetota bacterium]